MMMLNLKMRNFVLLLFTWGCLVVFINLFYVNNLVALDSILHNNNSRSNSITTVHNDNFRIHNNAKKSKAKVDEKKFDEKPIISKKDLQVSSRMIKKNTKKKNLNDNNDNDNGEKKEHEQRHEQQHEQQHEQHEHQIAGLDCDKYGGPYSHDIVSEMVYWKDIPSDTNFVSPYKNYDGSKKKKYLTFEPDRGGWNNIRMGMETAVALAYATGRTLVLPKEGKMYLLDKDDSNNPNNNRFTFKEFFHFDTIAKEHYKSLEIISMEEFLSTVVMTGQFLNTTSNESMFPPNNKTDWDGNVKKGSEFYHWLRNSAGTPIWYYKKCMVGFDNKPGGTYDDTSNTSKMKNYYEKVKEIRSSRTTRDDIDHGKVYLDKPTPVDAKPTERLSEMLYGNKTICHYDKYWQDQQVLHFMGDKTWGARLLVHFYAFMFFEDYHFDLIVKRFIRDHLRYIDEIQCAAARIVHEMKQIAIANGDPNGNFDTFHIRRGDFQYSKTRIEAEEILDNTKDILVDNSTIFIATDEKNTEFFIPFQKQKQNYKIYFLKDFKHLYKGINKNYYGMLDQLVASKGRTFIGSFYSTFTGFINRMRGYHSQNKKLPGHELGHINSYFYTPFKKKDKMRHYFPLDESPLWATEFPIAWRDIDHDVDVVDDDDAAVVQ